MRRRITIALVALAAVGLLVAVLVNASTGRVSTAATFVADVPWASAVVSSRGATTVDVEGDVEGMDDRFDCGPTVRPHVTETSTTVVIRVALYNEPLPPNTACAGAGLVDVDASVHLRSPIGTRALVDATDSARHPALVVDEQPTIRAVPVRFVRKRTWWDEGTGAVAEWWRWQQHHESQQIDLDLAPIGAGPGFSAPPSDAHHPRIGRATGTAWREAVGDTVTTTVIWSPGAGRTDRLTLIDQAKHPLSESAVLALARSVS